LPTGRSWLAGSVLRRITMVRRILLATDGTPAAAGALHLALRLAEERGFVVEVLGVVEPLPVFDAGFMVALPEVELYQSRQDGLRREILAQLGGLGIQAREWPVTILSGSPGPQIVARAEEVDAHTIVMGLGRHRPVDRVFGTETALQVIRLSRIPVMAVPETARELPRSAAFAVDFSVFSRRAANAALALMKSPWEAHLVHVMSGMEFLPTLSDGWRHDVEEELRNRLEEFGQEMSRGSGDQIHVDLLEGEPAREILAFAEKRELELLAAGSHGLSFVGRLLMGSVSTRMIRASRVSVLIVPPLERPEDVFLGDGVDRGVHPWVRNLKEFTQANAGRRTTVEVVDPELGVQVCARNLSLWGVDYDPRRDRIHIMMGRAGTVEGHLTHSLAAPKDVHVVRGEGGRSEALFVELQEGKVILRILRD
jgi:nucleotide-binding universal stress UspA family protein